MVSAENLCRSLEVLAAIASTKENPFVAVVAIFYYNPVHRINKILDIKAPSYIIRHNLVYFAQVAQYEN